ncbi:MAG: aminoacyl-tRNA hydrolase [Spirochaetaceae bacterium]
MTFLIIGLGNPGFKYSGTRHNAGFDVVNKMASKFSVNFKKPLFKNYYIAKIRHENNLFILIKPNTFMNRSGEVIPGLLYKYKLTHNNLIVVVDNLDINKGYLKFKLKGSDGGHNGLKSIYDYIGTNEYKRLFVGIGRPTDGESIIEYVLSKMEDSAIFDAIDRSVQGLLKLPTDRIDQIMNYLNRRKLD